MRHERAGLFNVVPGRPGSSHANEGAGADQEDDAPDFVLVGDCAGVGEEREVGDPDNGDHIGHEAEEAEGAAGEADGTGVLVQVEGDLGDSYGGGDEDLLGGLQAGGGCGSADAGLAPKKSVAVRDLGVGHVDGLFFRPLDGESPFLRLNVLLQASETYR